MTQYESIGEGLRIEFDGERYNIYANNETDPMITLSESMIEKIEFYREKIGENYV